MSTSSSYTLRSGVITSRGRGTSSSSLFGEALALLAGGLDRADVVESLLRKVVVLPVEHLAEAPNGVGDLHVLARDAGELLGHEHGLREESLQFPRACHEQLVFIA